MKQLSKNADKSVVALYVILWKFFNSVALTCLSLIHCSSMAAIPGDTVSMAAAAVKNEDCTYDDYLDS